MLRLPRPLCLAFPVLLGLAAPSAARAVTTLPVPETFAVFASTMGAAISTAAVAGPGAGETSVQVTYDLTSGPYVGIEHLVDEVRVSTASASGIRFFYKATGVSNTLELKFVDRDDPEPLLSDKLVYQATMTADGAWREQRVPWSAFKTFPDGDGHFDLGILTRFGVGATRPNGNDTDGSALFIDDIALYNEASWSALIDGFESGATTNARFAAVYLGPGATEGSGTYVTSPVNSGAQALQLTCTGAGSGFFFAAEDLAGAPTDPTHSVRFFARALVGTVPLRVRIQDHNGVTESNTVQVSVNSGSYQMFTLPLTSFAGALDRTRLDQVVFVLQSAGTVFIDDVSIVGTSAAPAGVVRMIEDFRFDKADLGFGEYTVPGFSQLVFDVVRDRSDASPTNRVGRLTYAFLPGSLTSYAVIERPLTPNLAAEPVVRFRYMGTGADATVEIKLKDADGTVVERRLRNGADTGGAWRTLDMPVGDFVLLSDQLGTISGFNAMTVSSFTLALSQGEAGPGVFTLAPLQILPKTAFEKDFGGTVLGQIATPNNPFSPNGDGVRDEGLIAFTLKEPADVSLTLYSLRGETVRRFAPGALAAGDHVLVWDGVDEEGRAVANGLYFFFLKAQGSTTDTFKQVVGVMR